MKKNWFVRSAVLMFALVIVSCSVFGGTLAKYTVSIGGVADTARVAKFAFDLNGTPYDGSAVDVNIFSKYYVDAATGNTGAAAAAAGQTVWSNDTDDVVAPGTKGVIPFTVENTGEVAITIDSITVTEDAESDIPIVFTVDETAVDTVIFGGGNATVNVTWEWAFNGDDAAKSAEDTVLGLEGLEEYTANVAVTVSQVD